jgi:DUF4097 and DUF4098 domain-containing protein YvlB
MKLLTTAALVGLAASAGSISLFAQLQNNTEKQLTCNNNSGDRDRARHCEVRELSVASIGRLSIDSSPNGGISIKGWSRGDVLVRARVEASADTEGTAANLVSRVAIDGSGGQVRATGPESANESWSVSYEVFVPHMTDVTLKTRNGGLTIADVRGQIKFDGVNGGVRLKRVSGEISGATVNGGIDVEMAGMVADWRQMDLKTNNGGITVAMPAQYSADVQAETGQGRIQSDFPMPPSTDFRNRRMAFAVGAGGPPMRLTTNNGGIRLKRIDTQQ